MENGAGGDTQELTFQTRWPEGLTENAQVINQFAMVNDNTPGEPGMYLLLGHIGAPVWTTPDHARQIAEETSGILGIAPRGSFFLSRFRAEELWGMLGKHLGKLPAES